MSTEGSMAVWASPRSTTQSTGEVHFNYWRISGHKEGVFGSGAEDIAEIGVLLDSPTDVEEISIFLPAKRACLNISDCAPQFSRVEIAQGIFNELLSCKSVGAPHPQSIELEKVGGGLLCRVHQFPKVNGVLDPAQLSISDTSNGTIVTVMRKAINESCVNLPAGSAVYFRIRASINSKAEAPFIKVISPKDSAFHSGFDEIEYIDFRFNDTRTLPPQIASELRNTDLVRFRVMAFLTAIPVSANLTSSSSDPHKSRLLEKDVWKDYIPGGLPKGMMVYHWKKSDPNGVDSFSAFVKMQTRKTGIWVLFIYLGFALVFGMVGNLLASAVEGAMLAHWRGEASSEDSQKPEAMSPEGAAKMNDSQKGPARPPVNVSARGGTHGAG